MAGSGIAALRPIADGLGLLASTVCAVHCLLLPTLLVAGSTLPSFLLSDESFHRALLWLILPSALIAFGLGCWRHKDRGVLALGTAGLLGIVLSAALHDVLGESNERTATLASAAVLVAAHVRNFRRCRASRCDHDPD
ncbi:MAG: MerC domain-containing protein [Gemmatimonadetes bacterium]|nr:MerC domain-containing protein [Gemmatimonadota bacterium]